jgi:hypothetical protein
MVLALRDAHGDHEEILASHFTVTEELLAQILEFLSIMRIEALALGRVKPRDLPEPIRVPRPGVEPVDPIPTITPREFVMMMQGA